jgi:hypothetical protein
MQVAHMPVHVYRLLLCCLFSPPFVCGWLAQPAHCAWAAAAPNSGDKATDRRKVHERRRIAEHTEEKRNMRQNFQMDHIREHVVPHLQLDRIDSSGEQAVLLWTPKLFPRN